MNTWRIWTEFNSNNFYQDWSWMEGFTDEVGDFVGFYVLWEIDVGWTFGKIDYEPLGSGPHSWGHGTFPSHWVLL